MRRYKPEWRTRLTVWFAWHLPREVAYWCAVRVVTHASTTTLADAEMGSITTMDALEAWHVLPVEPEQEQTHV